jgi:hypothetical protein
MAFALLLVAVRVSVMMMMMMMMTVCEEKLLSYDLIIVYQNSRCTHTPYEDGWCVPYRKTQRYYIIP